MSRVLLTNVCAPPYLGSIFETPEGSAGTSCCLQLLDEQSQTVRALRRPRQDHDHPRCAVAVALFVDIHGIAFEPSPVTLLMDSTIGLLAGHGLYQFIRLECNVHAIHAAARFGVLTLLDSALRR